MRTMTEILGKDSLINFLTKCQVDFKFFCERVLGFTVKPFHLEWFNNRQNNSRVSILAPTGFGKTTILGIAFPLWKVFFSRNKQVLIISKTLPQATRVLMIIRGTIEDNELLLDLKPKNASETWSKQIIETSTKCKILCRPYSINIKGEHVDIIILDEASSYQDTNLYFDYVVPRCAAKNGKIILISTPESTSDLMAVIKTREAVYSSKSYPAIVNGESIWPEQFPMEKLRATEKELGDQFFKKNYMCDPTAESEDSIFKMSGIMDCFDTQRGFSTDIKGKSYMGCDFAISDSPTADFDAYVVIDKVDNYFIIKHIEIHKGFITTAKTRRIGELHELYKTLKIRVDESNIGSTVIDDMRGKALPIIPQGFHSKERRALLNNLRNVIDGKKLIIPRSGNDMKAIKLTNELTKQLIGFVEVRNQLTGNRNIISTSAHDDIVMALAMAVKEAVRQKSTSVYGASAS